MRHRGPRLISCPTCGRTEVDLERIAAEVEAALAAFGGPLRVAVMGCVVNGPGEARQADVGLAGGKGEFLIFRKGEVIRKVPEENAVAALLDEIRSFCAERDRDKEST